MAPRSPVLLPSSAIEMGSSNTHDATPSYRTNAYEYPSPGGSEEARALCQSPPADSPMLSPLSLGMPRSSTAGGLPPTLYLDIAPEEEQAEWDLHTEANTARAFEASPPASTSPPARSTTREGTRLSAVSYPC